MSCGIEFGGMALPGRPVAALDVHVLYGTAHEPADRLGIAHTLGETITKGTERRDGRGVLDAFDAIGAQHGEGAGRETTSFRCLVLPEFLDDAIDLYAEILRTPSFPEDACGVALELALQELHSLEDDPQGLADKLIDKQAYGPYLGRHGLGERETLERITQADVVGEWRRGFSADRMQVAVAGDIDPERVADHLERAFAGFGSPDDGLPDAFELSFAAAASHHQKQLEQEQIAICWPGVAVPDEDFPVERVMLGVLSGGMSGRLFTEVREKQGLVYWVDAWHDHPRRSGMLHLGASTTPERCDKTYRTLLGEVDRLSEDLTGEEVARAITGIEARTETRGDITSARCAELLGDLYYRGHPVPTEEKLARVRAVTVEDIKRYLDAHPRDQLSVVTLGPRELGTTG